LRIRLDPDTVRSGCPDRSSTATRWPIAYRIDDDTSQLWVVPDGGTPRKGAQVIGKGTIREGFNLGSLGDQIHLPGVGGRLVLLESSHKAKS
jgi:hypothetical protein